MDWLEDELKQALSRKDPPAGFAARVSAAARRPQMVRRWMPVAAAVVLVAGSSGAAWRRHQGMVAKEKVMLAMKITAGQLSRIQAKVLEARQ